MTDAKESKTPTYDSAMEHLEKAILHILRISPRMKGRLLQELCDPDAFFRENVTAVLHSLEDSTDVVLNKLLARRAILAEAILAELEGGREAQSVHLRLAPFTCPDTQRVLSHINNSANPVSYAQLLAELNTNVNNLSCDLQHLVAGRHIASFIKGDTVYYCPNNVQEGARTPAKDTIKKGPLTAAYHAGSGATPALGRLATVVEAGDRELQELRERIEAIETTSKPTVQAPYVQLPRGFFMGLFGQWGQLYSENTIGGLTTMSGVLKDLCRQHGCDYEEMKELLKEAMNND